MCFEISLCVPSKSTVTDVTLKHWLGVTQGHCIW